MNNKHAPKLGLGKNHLGNCQFLVRKLHKLMPHQHNMFILNMDFKFHVNKILFTIQQLLICDYLNIYETL